MITVSQILDRIDAILDSVTVGMYGGFHATFADLFWELAGLSLIILTFFIMWSHSRPNEYKTWFGRLVMMGFFMMSWPMVDAWIYPLFYEWPMEIATSIVFNMTGKEIVGNNALFDYLIGDSVQFLLNLFKFGRGIDGQLAALAFAIIASLGFGALIITAVIVTYIVKTFISISISLMSVIACFGVLPNGRTVLGAWLALMLTFSFQLLVSYMLLAFYVAITITFKSAILSVDPETFFAEAVVLVKAMSALAGASAYSIIFSANYARQLGGSIATYGVSGPMQNKHVQKAVRFIKTKQFGKGKR